MHYQPRSWMKAVLLFAALSHFVWAGLAICMPDGMFAWFGPDQSSTPSILWQCIGVLGLGFLIAARDPYRHWPIVLMGLLVNSLGVLGFTIALSTGEIPARTGWVVLVADLVWLAPFVVILWGAIQHHHAVGSAYETPEADIPLQELRTNTGQSLDHLANTQPQMVVFLRHFGCTFCREALAAISARRQEIEATGCGIVLVHLDESDGREFFAQYDMEDVPRISDPNCRLYRQFGLDLGEFRQLFGLQVWLRGIFAGLFQGHGLGWPHSNSFQMPGVFTYYRGQVIEGFQHDRASDRPDYVELAKRAA
ncbi:SelL-related redox protein [Allorhodopirellula solitaria]|uniref:AhpC/TSA family protein n=1 Tax=Allorhodopirellula solitaria TaxID=2527987 RepID=A0A5C5XS78_9BACT|nr:SelL-related redox protein [Allorhodopirellula solitaria]TWT64885.1 AhpC/TSA family protein [Allorhodopirellula solitaria]